MKKLILIIYSLITVASSYASHIVGGNFALCQTSSNDYEVNLIIYRGCLGVPVSPSLTVCVFDAVTNTQVSTITMSTTNLISQNVINIADSCNTNTGICIEENIFQSTMTLPNNPNGYYLTWSSCCRNGAVTNINNPVTQGNTYYVEIPDPALWSSGGNCTPSFGSHPSDGYLIINSANVIDLNVTDADGDSLVYSFVDPFSYNICHSKPFNTCTWASGLFSLSNILGNQTFTNPPMTIDPQSGIINCSPEFAGVFDFAVKVEEYRNGIKIGEVIKDIQYHSLPCATASISDESNARINVYPNPSNDIITINMSQLSDGQIILTDILGKEVFSKSFTTKKVQLNLNSLESKGTYFAKVLDSAGSVIAIKKLIYQ